MTGTLAISGRELRAFYLSPGAYIIAALFVLVCSVVFVSQVFIPGQVSTLRNVFQFATWVLMFVCPAISMRLVSEELRGGTYEILMTMPVSSSQIIMGKFLGAVAFLITLLIPTIVYVILLEVYGRPDYGAIISGYIGLILIGAAFLSTGLLTSCLTPSQPVAFLVAVFFWLAYRLGTKAIPGYLPSPWSNGVFAADPDPRAQDFIVGLIDSSNIVFFITLIAIMLIAAIQALELRRWR